MAGKFLRDAKKSGKGRGIPTGLPHEAVTDPPSPQASADMAAGGLNIVRGNSDLQALSPQGEQTVARTGSALQKLGGPSRIVSSTSQRALQTAQALQGPQGPPIEPAPGLESHAMGQLEGEPKTPGVRKLLADLMRKSPGLRIPGQGALSSQPGESFNDYRIRALSAVRAIMETLANSPLESIAVPTHSQVIKLVKAWIAAGTPDDLSVSPEVFLKASDEKPGSVERFAPNASGDWTLTPFDPERATSLPGGSIYFVRHGETPSEAVKTSQTSLGQRARAQVIAHVRSGDWGRVRAFGRKAVESGHLSDQDVEDAIDEALPGAESADDLSSRDLLNAAKAASPRKRKELLPALQRRFTPEAISSLPSQGQKILQDDLARLRSVS